VGFVGLLDFDSVNLVVSWPEQYYEYHLPVAAWMADGEHVVFIDNPLERR
jgi:hypothetical protein